MCNKKAIFDRFKITDAALKKAIKYVKSGDGKPPPWASKYKADLSVKGSKLFYKEREIVSRERVDAVLRDQLYKKGGDVPSGRDSAFHICKQRFVGISRRALMEFIRKQKPLGEVKAAMNKPKRAGGERLKNYIFETDLIFLKRRDLESANKKFRRDELPELSYFLSTVEKVTGLCRFDYVLKKDAALVTPKVIKHCEDMAKELKTTIAKCDIRFDKGGEFQIKKLAEVFKKAVHVNSGVAVENKNAQFQKCFFQVLRQRKAMDIEDAMRQSEKLLNNTFNRIHKKTSNELVERGDEKENILEYNRKRKTFIAGDKRKVFEVGQHVRKLVKSKKPGIDYKRYKNATYSKRVFVVTKVTKKAVPRKYRVDGTWWLQSDLLKSAPRDEKSIELIEERDEEEEKKEKKFIADRVKEVQENPKGLRRSKRHASKAAALQMLQSKVEQQEFDKRLDDIDDEKAGEPKKKKKPEQESKKDPPKRLSIKQKGLMKYLKRKGLPTGGNVPILLARIAKYKASKKVNK